MQTPELLAPAGSMEALRAAVENGANAVYLGGQAFNARASAANFSREELREAIEHAHLRGVKIYITVNILIDNGEIPELIDYVHYLYSIGADAVILQDLGIAYLLKNVLPEMPLHASTQMTLVNSAGVSLMQDLGFERIVLARETSLKDMGLIYNRTQAELEVFVHGALCVSYSGQCLMSSMIGGRSGNRGRCAQPCRMTYRLTELDSALEVPGIEVGEHLLSPRDLNLLDYIGDLAAAGISSLKVEGRMKRPEYVATVIRNYREVLDKLEFGEAKGSEEGHKELAQIFNRDFTTGYLFGYPGFELMSYKRPNNRGIMLGRVQRYSKEKKQVLIKLENELTIGDGIEVWTKRGREGVYVNRIWSDGREVEGALPGEQVWVEIPGVVSPGDRIFKTHDEKLVNRARLTYQEGKGKRRIPLEFKVEGSLGQPLRIEAVDPEGNQGEGVTDVNLEEALKRPLNDEYLLQQLDRLGNTPFQLEKVKYDLGENLIVPVREINEARRKAVEGVMLSRLGTRPAVSDRQLKDRVKNFRPEPRQWDKQRAQLSLTVGDFASLKRAVESGADIIYFGGDQFRSKSVMGDNEIKRGIEYCLTKGAVPVVQVPRLIHEGRRDRFAHYAEKVLGAGGEALQVADLGSLALAKENGLFKIFTDHGLNVFNDMSLEVLTQYGAEVITLSPELNMEQLKKLRKGYPVELVMFGALPLMITEYCPLGSLIGGGKREGCSQPCRLKRYGLKDRLNYVFPVETDQNCRMYLYNAKELNLLENLGDLVQLGAKSLRLELKKESPEYTAKVTKIFREELNRATANPTKYRPDSYSIEELEKLRPGGFTKGHYFRGVM